MRLRLRKQVILRKRVMLWAGEVYDNVDDMSVVKGEV